MRNVFIIALLLAAHSQPSPAAASKLRLPDQLASYRAWSQLLKVPYEVPLELYIRCVAPQPKDWQEAEKKYGPHTRKFIRVYGNPTALAAFAAKGPLPAGSIVVKEKFSGRPQGRPEGVAFMVKRNTSAFAASGGWEFLYYPASGDKQVTHRACAACHQAAKARDYIFGPYPRVRRSR